MKNIYLLLMVVFATTLSQAQTEKTKPAHTLWTTSNASAGQGAFLYEFSIDTVDYFELPDPISINQGEQWDDPEYIVPVDFPFYFMGEKIDILGFAGTGGLLFGLDDSMNNEIGALIFPFDSDLLDRGYLGSVSLSPLSYQVIGTPGNQVLVIEWKNAGSYVEYFDLGTLDMYISFQVWLYEVDNSIIFHYGPSMIDNPFNFYSFGDGPLTGLLGFDLINDEFINLHILDGPAENPMLSDDSGLIIGTPPNGIRYKFTPDISSVESTTKSLTVNVFPNPVGDILYITCEETMLEATLFSVAGVPIRNIPGHAINGSIDLGGLPLGSYMLQLVTPQGVHVSPIVKK